MGFLLGLTIGLSLGVLVATAYWILWACRAMHPLPDRSDDVRGIGA